MMRSRTLAGLGTAAVIAAACSTGTTGVGLGPGGPDSGEAAASSNPNTSASGADAARSPGGSSGSTSGGSSGSSSAAGSSGAGSGVGSGSGSASSGGNSSGSGSGSSSGSSSSGATGGSGSGADAGSCIGASMLSTLGKQRFVVGVSTTNATAAAAPFDLRYEYLAGGLFDQNAACTSCGAGCTASGSSCANGCAWWGCYVSNTTPGAYARDFVNSCAAASPRQIPMFTYYEILQTAVATISGFKEGTAEVTQAATNTALMTRYLADWRFLLQQIGQNVALLHIEPDFWGYARSAGSASTLAAAVASANPTDCASMPNTIAGMGQCMIAMVRKYAPKALVGLSASAWNVIGNTNASVDVSTDAKSVAAFLAACGQSNADFVVVETSDRDAGYYASQGKNTLWDPTNATLPNFHQDFAWVKALTEALRTPALYWQTPLGNASQNNTANHWTDNRVDYFFGHLNELAAAHAIGAAFGAGAGDQTTPDTDGGNLIAKTKAYAAGPGQTFCP